VDNSIKFTAFDFLCGRQLNLFLFHSIGSPWHIDIMPSSPGITALGESTRLVPANQPAVFEILPPPGTSLRTADCVATVLSPSKSKVNARITNEAASASGAMRIEFTPLEVGTHIIEACINGTKIVGGPLIAKVYDSSLIQVTDVNSGIVGQACQFRVDASAAGEGQLEISINDGEVPNHVQVVGGGRCLVSFTPEQAKPHLIDIKFNGETVRGCPFICSVADTSRVTLNLSNLELIPVNHPATFLITVRRIIFTLKNGMLTVYFYPLGQWRRCSRVGSERSKHPW
jgi:filamin